MDVNATLAEIRQLARAIVAGGTDDAAALADGDRLAELITALDGWIMRNGFLPTDWHRAQLAAVRGVPTAQG